MVHRVYISCVRLYADRHDVNRRACKARASGYYQALISVLLLCLVGQLHVGDTLEAVRFEGMRTFGRKDLASMVGARPGKPSSEAQLNNDVAILEAFYRSQGFHAVEVERQVARGKRRPVVTYRIAEGPRTRVSAIAISGNATIGTDRLLRQLLAKPGRFFSVGEFLQSAEVIRTHYLNSGYPFVQVRADTARSDTLATLTFEIDEGQLCHISKVLLRGNKTVSTRTALRASQVRPGERFSQERLRGAQRRLYATKLFSRVTYYVMTDSSTGPDSVRREVANSVTARFDVVEQPYRGVALGGGVEYYPLRAILSAEWEHDNLLNRGHTIVIGGEAGPTLLPFGKYRFAVDGTYRVPYLILTRIDFQTHPYVSYERFDSTLQREAGIETGMSRNVAPQFTIGLTNRLRLVSDTSRGKITNSLALTGNYDTRNDIFDPSRGLSVQVAVEGAGGPLLRGNNDLYKLTGDVRWYRRSGLVSAQSERVSGDLVLATRAMAGIVRPYGRTLEVPYYEAFTLGGGNSMRGYGDRSIGPDTTEVGQYRYGSAVVNANIELRTPYVLRLVGLVGFVDAGSVADGLRSLAWEYSVGAGVRLRTPIGPVRLDWGKRLRNPPAGDWGRFSIGLLHAF
jgi:outer membrane protein assembly complex protein YaeT